MKRTFSILLAFAASFSFAASRVGPVSQYGQLQAGTNASGKGRIYGSCAAYASAGNEVAVQGMSLFWSISSTDGSNFWTADIVNGLVSNHNIQLIRAPMGADEDWGEGNWATNSTQYSAYMNTVVQAAIDNDIYVIIDYHSHCAENSQSTALSFFTEMAKKWGSYDNVIFEIYNEPKNACSDTWFDLSGAQNYWSTIRSYAATVISVIRQYSDNLILVGTPYYDQYPNAALANPIDDSNVAYTFHYYAGEDTYRHTTDNQGANAVAAINGGLSVFVSEWGNSAPSGNGGFNASYSATWYDWMKTNQLSGANWSVSAKDETASYFTTSGAWNYSTSGSWVNANVFSALPTSYTACASAKLSSSSAASSSSAESSSSSAKSSSSSAIQSSSSAAKSSSSVSSSSSAKLSSSSAASSSSQGISSSSASNAFTVSGNLEQTVAKNSSMESVVFSGVTSFTRNSWNLSSYGSIDVAQSGTTVTISGTVADWAQPGTVLESFTVNGDTVVFTLHVVDGISSSSAVFEESSSSSESTTALSQAIPMQRVSATLVGRRLEITSAAPVDVAIFDMQGRLVRKISQIQGAVSLEALKSGSYIVRLQSGALHSTGRISLK